MISGVATWWVRAVAGAAVLIAAVGMVTAIVLVAGSATDQRILMAFLINATAAVALHIYVGNSGIISFGHTGFMALGAYASALFTADPAIKQSAIPDAPQIVLQSQVGPVPALLIGIIVAMAVAAIVGRVFVRLAGSAAAVATLGFMVVVFTVLSNAEALTRGSKAFSGIPAYTTFPVALGVLCSLILIARLCRDSDTGLGLRASADDAIAAQASGVDITASRYRLWVISAAGSAAAGVLYAHYIGAILPHAFHYNLTLLLVTMVIVGGHSVAGALAGTAVISVVAEVLRRMESGFSIGPLKLSEAPGLTTAVLAMLIVLTLTLRPGGLLGRWELDEIYDRWMARRLAHASHGAKEKSRILGGKR
jgi:branched-chain amino acid transport system permease protein